MQRLCFNVVAYYLEACGINQKSGMQNARPPVSNYWHIIDILEKKKPPRSVMTTWKHVQ